MDLTGCPTECIEFEDSDSAYQIENGDLFNKMRLYDEAGYLISGTTPGEDHMTEARGEGDKEEDKGKEEGEGLISGHAYSIIKVISCQGHQLLNIRNPWGNFEWQGDWCDKDKKNWTHSMIEEVKPEFGDDGTFWMSFADFASHFKSLNVCKVSDWEEVRVKGEFTNYKDQGSMDMTTLRSRYFYELTVSDADRRQRILIGLH